MKKSAFLLLCVLLFAPCTLIFAQRDIKAALKQDIVKVENGMFSIQEFGILPTFDKEYQVKITATAPQSLLSRDNFLRFYGAFSTTIFSNYLTSEGLQVPNELHVVLSDKPAAKIDLDVTVSMNEEGVEYVVVAENSKTKMNLQWLSQLYLDN